MMNFQLSMRSIIKYHQAQWCLRTLVGEHKCMTSEDFGVFGTIYNINHTTIRFWLTICVFIFNDVISLQSLTKNYTFFNWEGECLPQHPPSHSFYTVSNLSNYDFTFNSPWIWSFPKVFWTIIKESKPSEPCIRIKDPKGYVASLLCQKFINHVDVWTNFNTSQFEHTLGCNSGLASTKCRPPISTHMFYQFEYSSAAS